MLAVRLSTPWEAATLDPDADTTIQDDVSTRCRHRPQQPQIADSPPDVAASSPEDEVGGASSRPRASVIKRSPKDFYFLKVIGEGSFSTVYLSRDIHSDRDYAIKVLNKRQIIREKKKESVTNEKDALNILGSSAKTTVPFFTKLYCTFQDPDRLFFVMTYARNSDLLTHIQKVGSFDLECTKFYTAEILHALEHMHGLDIIHRDLKPENVLLSDSMHILIADFGSVKIGRSSHDPGSEASKSDVERRNSFVGTAQYVSPELLSDKVAYKSSDLWALGCIVYQMLHGSPPFTANIEYAIFKKILKLDYEFPENFPERARDLVQRLLVLEPNKRLGASDSVGYPSLRSHALFSGIDFESLYSQTPPKIHQQWTPPPPEDRTLPDNVEPGLGNKQLTRLLGLDLDDCCEAVPVPRIAGRKAGIADLGTEEVRNRLAEQRCSKWHDLVEGNLILKQGLVDKRKGLFARRRMLLLTMGPHLYYVDPTNMVLKGEIPWSPQLRVECKNFRAFFVHTPNRTYSLEDPKGYALEWCKAIEEVWTHTYGNRSQ